MTQLMFSTSESTNQTQVQTFTIPSMTKLNSVTSNTGTVTVTSVSGNQVTIRAINGSATRAVQTGETIITGDTKYVDIVRIVPAWKNTHVWDGYGWNFSTQQTLYPRSYNYDEGGYKGTLSLGTSWGADNEAMSYDGKEVWPTNPYVGQTFYTYQHSKDQYLGNVTKQEKVPQYTYYYKYNLTFDYETNNIPTLTLSTTNNLILNENDTLAINGSVLDTDNGNVLTMKYQINNEISQTIMTATSDGTSQIPFSKSLTFKSGKLHDSSIAVAASLSEGVSHELKVWVEDNVGGKSPEVIRKFTVVPIIKNTRNVSLSVNKNNDIFIVFEKYYNSNEIDIAMSINPHDTDRWIESDIVSKASKEVNPSTLYDPSLNFKVPLLVYKDDTKVGFYGSWIKNSRPTPPLLSEVNNNPKKAIEKVILTASSSSDLEKDNLTYFFEFYDGKKWVEFAGNKLANEKVNHYIPYIVKGSTNSKYRTRAFDGELYSDYTESNEFTVIAPLSEDYITDDITVVDKPYTTKGVGGRKLVRLSNGWLVAASSGEPERINFRISRNNGKNWVDSQPIRYDGNTLVDWSMIAKGMIIYVVYSVDNADTGASGLYYTKFDFSNEEGFIFGRKVSGAVTKMGNASFILSNDGNEVHAVWSCKNATYPNSFNIQYRKATFNLNGTLKWESIEQISTENVANFGVNYPSLITIDNNPIIFTEVVQSTADLGINMYTKIGNTWQTRRLYSDTDKTSIQSSPSAVYVPKSVNNLANGRIWLTWSGKSISNPDTSHIYVMYSDDKGVIWSSAQNLTK